MSDDNLYINQLPMNEWYILLSMQKAQSVWCRVSDYGMNILLERKKSRIVQRLWQSQVGFPRP